MTSTSDDRSIAIVFGTRPEIIKLAPLIRGLGSRAVVIHTGQHFDDNMSGAFLRQLRLGDPQYHLDVGGLTRGAQIGRSATAIEALLMELRPHAVVVQGDTNSGVGGAIAANAASIPLLHLEAGLRSFDRSMPEEHNRILIDAIADRCLAPHQTNAALLEREGIGTDRIAVTGSTLREALVPMMPDRSERLRLLHQHSLQPNEFVLATVHRPENADSPTRLATILTELAGLGVPTVLPLHPRARARVQEYRLEQLLEPLVVLEPLGYREFLGLAAEAALLVSDSGGVQEEATIIKRPVVIVRNSTERPELLGTFAHLVGVGPDISATAQRLLADVPAQHAMLADLPYPYGEGVVSRCLDVIDDVLA